MPLNPIRNSFPYELSEDTNTVSTPPSSARRYERIIEESIGEYYSRVSEIINAIFEQSQFKVKGLIVGGPGPTKEGFVKSNTLNYQIKILGVYDTGYTDEFGLNELVEKASDLLKEQEAYMERRVIERFIQEISHGGLATYGYENTKKALLANQAGTLIINNDLEMYMVEYKCSSCNQIVRSMESEVKQKRHECGGTLDPISREDAIAELVGIADEGGVDTVFVSSESSYGKWRFHGEELYRCLSRVVRDVAAEYRKGGQSARR